MMMMMIVIIIISGRRSVSASNADGCRPCLQKPPWATRPPGAVRVPGEGVYVGVYEDPAVTLARTPDLDVYGVPADALARTTDLLAIRGVPAAVRAGRPYERPHQLSRRPPLTPGQLTPEAFGARPLRWGQPGGHGGSAPSLGSAGGHGAGRSIGGLGSALRQRLRRLIQRPAVRPGHRHKPAAETE
ncbi:unnamed protein product [Lampetra fluviatilis]